MPRLPDPSRLETRRRNRTFRWLLALLPSIVDLAPIPEGGTVTEAFENTTERARSAEALGYSRFWVAEHHDFTDRLASTTPEALIAHLAGETTEIRVGSGTVLLNHYSPYKVAETFGVLDALAPGLADALDLATGTVSEHLQRIEAKLIGAYVDPPRRASFGRDEDRGASSRSNAGSREPRGVA